MNIVQPIRDAEDIDRMKAILRRRSCRDYMLFVLGCNTALRVGDLVALTASDVRGVDGEIKSHICVKEEKTDKAYRFRLPESVRAELAAYTASMPPDAPLFPSRKGGEHISTTQAWRVLKGAADSAGIEDNVGTHSLRKTFGYHAYNKTHNVAVVQKVLNHSSPSITKRYIGIDDDEVDRALEGFEL
jgi:integrase